MIICRRDRIEDAITRAGATQAGIAEHMGVSPVQINDVISFRRPGTKLLTAMATFLQVPASWLADGVAPPPWVLPADILLPPAQHQERECRAYVLAVLAEVVRRWSAMQRSDPRLYARRRSLINPIHRLQLESPQGPAWWMWSVEDVDCLCMGVHVTLKEWGKSFERGFASIIQIPEPSHLARIERKDPYVVVTASTLAAMFGRDAFERQSQAPWARAHMTPINLAWAMMTKTIATTAERNQESLEPVKALLAEPLEFYQEPAEALL